MTRVLKVSVIGTVGVPARYGGFETLVENLVRTSKKLASDIDLTIFCSAKSYSERPSYYHGARLLYVPLRANGVQSIPYDIWSIVKATMFLRSDVVLVLGVSGAVVVPFVRLLGKSRIVTNVDGIEWKRKKWRGVSRWFLRVSERIAARYSHTVIADNDHIADHIRKTYGVCCETIAYGGDHVLVSHEPLQQLRTLPEDFALTVCRIEPENNIRMIVETFARARQSLVMVGNWCSSTYGQQIREEFGNNPAIRLLNPIYVNSMFRLAVCERGKEKK